MAEEHTQHHTKSNSSLMWIGIIVVIVIVVGAIALTYKGGGNAGSATTTTPYTTTSSGTNASSSSTTTATTQQTYYFNVTEKEYSITPNVINVTHGSRVVLNVWNMGTLTHNLQVASTGTPLISPDTNYTLIFTAPAAGQYTMIDSLGNDQNYGMIGTLNVR